MSDEEYIQFEEIPEEPEQLPIIGIYRDAEGHIGYASILSNPLEVARLFSALATNILENEVNGRNARTYRFFGR